MDNTNTQPDHPPKAEWKAPELLRLVINTQTRLTFDPGSGDGSWGQAAS